MKIKHIMPKDYKRGDNGNDDRLDTEPDKLLEEINSYQRKPKKQKKSTKKQIRELDDDEQMEKDLRRELGHEQKLDDLLD